MASSSKVILHLVHRLTFGGAERVLVNYINGSQLHKHIICSFYAADSFKDELSDPTVPVIDLDKRDGNDLSIPLKLWKICRQQDVDIIHCQGWGTYPEGLLCSLLTFLRVKFIFSFHGKTIADLEYLPKRRTLFQKAGSFLSSAIIAPSDDMQRDYAETIGIDPSMVTVLHNGVDTEHFVPDAVNDLRNTAFGCGDDVIVFGCVARLDPVKNFPGLIKAFDRVLSAGLRAKLVIVGDGALMADLNALVKQLGREDDIVFTGLRTDIADCLSAIDIYVQASFYEGFSMTVLEAMSCGLPVIAYDVGGTCEMLKHDVNGLLLAPEEGTDALTQAMIDLAGNRQRRIHMGQASRTIIEQNFSLTLMNDRYDRLFALTGKH